MGLRCHPCFLFLSLGLFLNVALGAHPGPPNCSRPDLVSARPNNLIAGHPYLPGLTGDGGPATLARLRLPTFLVLDETTQMLYISDTDNHAVRVANLTSNGLDLFAGQPGTSGNAGDGGLASRAQLCSPRGLVLNLQVRQLYIADYCNDAIREVSLDTQYISVLVGKPAATANASAGGTSANIAGILDRPVGMALDPGARRLYITNFGSGDVIALDLDTGQSTTILVGLNQPMGITLDIPNSLVYVACYGSHTIARFMVSDQTLVGYWNISVSNVSTNFVGSGILPTETGDGSMNDHPADVARLRHPTDVALFQQGQKLYIADGANPAIIMLDIGSMIVSNAISRTGMYYYLTSKDDVVPVGIHLEEPAIQGFRILYDIRSFDDKLYHGEWFYFDDRIAPNFTEGIHTIYHYRSGNLLGIKHVRMYKHTIYMNGRPSTCPTCNAQGVQEFDSDRKPFEFLVDDVLHLDYLFPPTRHRLFIGEGHNHIVRYSDVSKDQAYICQPGWQQWRMKQPEPLHPNDNGIQCCWGGGR